MWLSLSFCCMFFSISFFSLNVSSLKRDLAADMKHPGDASTVSSKFSFSKPFQVGASSKQQYTALVVSAVDSYQWNWIIYNYSPKGRWIVVDIYRDAKRWGIYPPLFTDPEGDSCFSIYQIRWIKKRFFNIFFWNFRETTRHFSVRSQNSEYPRIFRVMGANQNARKLLSTDLVNTKHNNYWLISDTISMQNVVFGRQIRYQTIA